ncbi:MAG TPA: DNA internalization-related competence protein ComEC/Rec2 [Geobacter sp.]|nr:DNA internalization-related competence protein ComEC/Rec2 [Geobacter sp.]
MPLASLVAGLVAADMLDAVAPVWALSAVVVATLAACFVRGAFPFLLSLSLLFFLWGTLSLRPFLHPSDHLAVFAGEAPVEIEGVLDRRPEEMASGGGKIYLQVERVRAEGTDRAVRARLLVYVKQGRARLCTGDRILFSSRLRQPRRYGIPGETDQARRLAYQRIFETAFVMEPDDLVLLREGAGWRHWVDEVAGSLGAFIVEREPGVEGGVLKALLLGDKGDVPEGLNDAYARSGVNHILSISGFHVGIVFLSLFHSLYFVARRSEFLALHLNLKQALLVASLPVVVFYLVLSGEGAATVRSVLMIAGVVAALHLKREIEPVNAIMLAAFIILVAAPETLFDVSFQLSFLAIWGIVVLAQPLSAPFSGLGKKMRWLLLLAAASLAAILATLVPVAYYFQRISFVGIASNLVIVPLLGYGAVVAGFASLPLSFVAETPAEALLHLAGFLVRLSDTIIVSLARAPVLSAYAPKRLDILLACLALCAVTFLRSRMRCLFALIPLVMVLAFRALPAAGEGDGMLRAYFLSVGQGDAALLRLPDGKWMVVDGGGNATDAGSRVGSRLLAPALRSLAVRRVDYLVLSHEHPDHLQGVLYLATYFDVGEFWESGVPSSSPEYLQLKWVLSARGIPVRTVNGTSSPFAVGGAMVEPLSPASTQPPASGDANDGSMVLRLSYGKSSILFTGDIGSRTEEELLERGVSLRCSLLKVAHHGSRYASGDPFLAAANPRAAVISAGFGNSFRLPSRPTLERLQRKGIPVYRTDLEGTVQAVCGAGGTLEVTTPWGAF